MEGLALGLYNRQEKPASYVPTKRASEAQPQSGDASLSGSKALGAEE
jgi:hypothetical protein